MILCVCLHPSGPLTIISYLRRKRSMHLRATNTFKSVPLYWWWWWCGLLFLFDRSHQQQRDGNMGWFHFSSFKGVLCYWSCTFPFVWDVRLTQFIEYWEISISSPPPKALPNYQCYTNLLAMAYAYIPAIRVSAFMLVIGYKRAWKNAQSSCHYTFFPLILGKSPTCFRPFMLCSTESLFMRSYKQTISIIPNNIIIHAYHKHYTILSLPNSTVYIYNYYYY